MHKRKDEVIKIGQYYKPISIENRDHIYSHDYDSGPKLMEHSYVVNKFVGAAMRQLLPGQPWHKTRIVWAGDYGNLALKDFPETNPLTALSHDLVNLTGEGENLYHQCDPNTIKPKSMTNALQKKCVLYNHTKKLFVLYSKLKPDKNGWTINPLPLLTSNGNGQGGGDYEGTSMDLVGSWAGDVISINDKPAPVGYEELIPEFDEK